MRTNPISILAMGLLVFMLLIANASAGGPNPAAVNRWRNICWSKNKNTVWAINRMCSGDIRGFTDYATKGLSVGKSHVSIQASCNLYKLIPKAWCSAQFFQTCAEGNKQGNGVKYYDGGCQHFMIG